MMEQRTRQSPHLVGALAFKGPRCQRPCDRRERVQTSGPDHRGPHHDHCLASLAPKPPLPKPLDRRRLTRASRPPQIPGPEPVPMEHQPPPQRPARRATGRAMRRTDRLDRRHLGGPRLDADLGVDDSLRASLLACQSDPKQTRRGAANAPSPFFSQRSGGSSPPPPALP